MNSTAPIIDLQDINFSYPGGKTVLDHLNFEFYKGDRVGLIAPNGSGKTTFFHIVMGLSTPTSGSIQLFGNEIQDPKDFEDVRRRIGFLFQDPDDQLFSPTVLEDVAFGPLNLGKSKNEAIDIARQTLADLGLEGFEDRVTFKLSGGEKRLVSLATVLSMEPEVLLLDEPLNALDMDTGKKITNIIANLDLSYIIISHDIDFALQTTDKICTIKDGKINFDPDAQVHEHRHLHPLGKVPHQHD
ncbi:MAG: ABC transporter ATP-binding protein [Desulfobacterales bacterium]|jgi:cobalt/nickel transport system ATP-binding protein